VREATWQKFGEFKSGIIGRKGESAVARVLSESGVAALHDVLLPDELGVTQIDHLVWHQQAVFVIETKTYGGHITGLVDAAQWVQHLNCGETQHVFQNPVHQNRRHCRAVRALLSGLEVPVMGVIVSAGSATFSAEVRGSVVLLPDLAAFLGAASEHLREPSQLQLAVAWQQLCAVVAQAEPRREEHRETVRRRRAGDVECVTAADGEWR
jgi:hypothetical protein